VLPLAEAIRRHVTPGMHLHLASTPSRSNAAIRELARAFMDRPKDREPAFCLSSTGFHSMAHLLPRLGLARRLIGCFFGDHFPAPRPNPLYAQRDLEIIHWPLWSLVASLRAGAQGDAWVVNRSLRGTSMAGQLAAHGMYREVAIPGEPAPLGLCAAIRPDITFVHAAAADDEGHVLMAAPLSEGPWSALAARRGVIVTVERIVPAALTRAHRASIVLPPHRVLAVCEEPFGAHPQPLLAPLGLEVPSYRDDFDHYERWRALATDDRDFADFVDRVLRAPDAGAAYRAYVGAGPLAHLAAKPARPALPDERPAIVAARAEPGVNQLIIAGARQIAARVHATGVQVVIAGIGHAFFATRIAQRQLAAAGVTVRVMVETGLYDVDTGPGGHGYLLAYDNMVRARRVSAIDDILGVLVGGADNRCLAVLGAAQIDRRGNLNSTRIAGKPLTGSGGACDIAAAAAEVIVMTRLAPGRLVDHLDYLTSPGHAVRSIVTDRGVLVRDPDDPTSPTWRLSSPWDDDARVAFARDCAWPLASDPADPAAPITSEEARLLDTLDPTGKYRHRAG
jgi:acyl CoA:acetate/3-ketoacid CoA transferase beta subunit/acyl CoA:acetate/3-ketoacid CoA transferase alpha subunit